MEQLYSIILILAAAFAPIDAAHDTDFTRTTIATNGNRAMAIDSDGNLWGWGSNWTGLVGDGTTYDQHSPVWLMDDVVSVAMGSSHTMVIRSDGSLWGWGSNYHWALGLDSRDDSTLEPIKIMDDVIAVSAGSFHTMAITRDGTLWGWGFNRWGEIGHGQNPWVHTPTRIMDDVIAVSAGSSHTMAITRDGNLWGWGYNRSREIGIESEGLTVREPTRIMDDVVYVHASSVRTYAIRGDGTLWGWGANDDGLLGAGTTEHPHEPIKIMDDVIAVSSGGSVMMAVTGDGTLWGWGMNLYEMHSNIDTMGLYPGMGWVMAAFFGLMDGMFLYTPTKITDNVVAVTVGWQTALAIKSDGSLYSWGNNWYGQVGDGTTTDRPYPVHIMDNIMLP